MVVKLYGFIGNALVFELFNQVIEAQAVFFQSAFGATKLLGPQGSSIVNGFILFFSTGSAGVQP